MTRKLLWLALVIALEVVLETVMMYGTKRYGWINFRLKLSSDVDLLN